MHDLSFSSPGPGGRWRFSPGSPSGCAAEFAALADALGVLLVAVDRRVQTACPGLAHSADTLGSGPPDVGGR